MRFLQKRGSRQRQLLQRRASVPSRGAHGPRQQATHAYPRSASLARIALSPQRLSKAASAAHRLRALKLLPLKRQHALVLVQRRQVGPRRVKGGVEVVREGLQDWEIGGRQAVGRATAAACKATERRVAATRQLRAAYAVPPLSMPSSQLLRIGTLPQQGRRGPRSSANGDTGPSGELPQALSPPWRSHLADRLGVRRHGERAALQAGGAKPTLGGGWQKRGELPAGPRRSGMVPGSLLAMFGGRSEERALLCWALHLCPPICGSPRPPAPVLSFAAASRLLTLAADCCSRGSGARASHTQRREEPRLAWGALCPHLEPQRRADGAAGLQQRPLQRQAAAAAAPRDRWRRGRGPPRRPRHRPGRPPLLRPQQAGAAALCALRARLPRGSVRCRGCCWLGAACRALLVSGGGWGDAAAAIGNRLLGFFPLFAALPAGT